MKVNDSAKLFHLYNVITILPARSQSCERRN